MGRTMRKQSLDIEDIAHRKELTDFLGRHGVRVDAKATLGAIAKCYVRRFPEIVLRANPTFGPWYSKNIRALVDVVRRMPNGKGEHSP